VGGKVAEVHEVAINHAEDGLVDELLLVVGQLVAHLFPLNEDFRTRVLDDLEELLLCHRA